MTPQELAEIDQKVAEAIGGIETKGRWKFPWGGGATVSTERSYDEEGIHWDEDTNVWRPAADWNDAMLAAEKAGLFTGKDLFSLSKSSKGKEFWICLVGDPAGIIAESGPLCISLAILHLKGKK
jgi:hypothetical protein